MMSSSTQGSQPQGKGSNPPMVLVREDLGLDKLTKKLMEGKCRVRHKKAVGPNGCADVVLCWFSNVTYFESSWCVEFSNVCARWLRASQQRWNQNLTKGTTDAAQKNSYLFVCFVVKGIYSHPGNWAVVSFHTGQGNRKVKLCVLWLLCAFEICFDSYIACITGNKRSLTCNYNLFQNRLNKLNKSFQAWFFFPMLVCSRYM